MSVIKSIKDINNNEFLFPCEDKTKVSVLSTGYIITPDGEFVVVEDNYHLTVFMEYLRNYTKKEYPDLTTMEAIKELIDLNHIVYLGGREKETEQIINNSLQGFLLIPNKLNDLTQALKESCIAFLKTNKSLFGDYEKIKMNIHQLNDLEIPFISSNELIELFENELAKSSRNL